jgi:hypothetical protein
VRPAVDSPSAIIGFGSSARIYSFATRTVLLFPPLRCLYYYGMGLGPGTGATPQIANAHGGRGGVGIRNSLP